MTFRCKSCSRTMERKPSRDGHWNPEFTKFCYSVEYEIIESKVNVN